MIGRITGTLAEKQPPHVLVDVGGIGYEIDVPMSTFYNLPATGERITLYTHLTIREDAHLLYGFGTEAERQAFRQLLKVSGIGAKTALSVLSGMSVTDLANAIAAQETGRITKVPGIGKKTAERLLLELRDKFSAAVATIATTGATPSSEADILNALNALGYNDKEALWAVKQLPADASVSDGIRQALKALSKS
ncbi:MAG: Holliday junction branch migration protein RuvA [Burkholderiales bacterium]|nr:Holliday junction branch migration protein RuvA [Burkholderiales bacterium]